MHLANQAAVLAVARIFNYGLLLLSPVVLARLLSVEDFGRYREFLVYAGLLQTIAAFSFGESLLYFIPRYAQSPSRVVRQNLLLTGLASSVVVAALIAADTASGRALVGEYLVPLALYTLLLANFDCWEPYFIATRRPGAVFAYSFARLTARMVTVITVAALTRDVRIIIWSLIGVEAVRFTLAALVWRAHDRAAQESPLPGLWREQLRFCLPTGAGALLQTASGTLARIVVVKMLGHAALARYTVGMYIDPIILAVRNSLTSVVLPEMVRRGQGDAPLALWHRATVMNGLLLFPLAVGIARFAEPIVTAVFGTDYREAAPVLQIAMLILVRECFDFAPPLRSVNRTMPIMQGNLIALLVCAGGLALLLPEYGIVGAVTAVALAKICDGVFLGWQVMRVRGLRLPQLLDWRAIGKVTLAAILAGVVIADSFWTDWFGAAGVLLAAPAYGAAYLLLLAVLRVAELQVLFGGLRRIALAMLPSARGSARGS